MMDSNFQERTFSDENKHDQIGLLNYILPLKFFFIAFLFISIGFSLLNSLKSAICNGNYFLESIFIFITFIVGIALGYSSFYAFKKKDHSSYQ